MKVDDILADEMHDTGVAFPGPELFHAASVVLAPAIGGRKVPYRRIEPDVEEFVRRAGNSEAEVRAIAGDAPLPEPVIDPRLHEVAHVVLEQTRSGNKVAEELLALGKSHVQVLRLFKDGRPLANHAPGFAEVGRLVGGAARFAYVAVLIRRVAFGTGADDEAVGQEPPVVLAVELVDLSLDNKPVCFQVFIDMFGVEPVFLGVGRVEDVEIDVEPFIIADMVDSRRVHERFGSNAALQGAEFYRRAVRVVGRHVHRFVSEELLVPYVHVGLHGFEQVAQVDVAIGIGKGHGDEQLLWGAVLVMRHVRSFLS